MALFSFADISFKPLTRRGPGSSGALLGSKKYDILRYPTDLGTYDKGHYLVIHINEQTNTQFESRPTSTGDVPTIIQNQADFGTSNLGGVTGVVADTVTSTASALGLGQIKLNFQRTIRRTTDTIALYMPDTLNFAQNQGYSELNIGGGRGALAATGATSAVDSIKNAPAGATGVADAISRNASSALALLASSNDLTRVGFAAFTGRVLNPMLEMLYTAPAFREFRFDFMLYPRSEEESKEVQNILALLRYHQSPEIDARTSGFLLIPPSEFDIKFYYNGAENPNIPKISTCVLTTLDVDYAPNGFAAYEERLNVSPNIGGTGMPVAIRLSLSFRETEYFTKANYKNEVKSAFNGGAVE
jgi:hypothetical protein